MKKPKILIITLATIILITAIAIILSTGNEHKFRPVNPAFREYISAFTSGVISTHSTIKIRLANDYCDTIAINSPAPSGLFSFSPDIKGSAWWIDKRTIEFRPQTTLTPGEFYNAKFFLSQLIKIPDSLKTFEFQFVALKQDFELVIENLKPNKNSDLRKEKLYGQILTADISDNAGIEKMLKASQESHQLPVSWTHDTGGKIHHFQVDSVVRGKEPGKLKLEWDGKLINAENHGDSTITVPSLDQFLFVNAQVVQGQEQYVNVRFTDPLADNQNLDGLFNLSGMGLRYAMEDNELRIYLPEEHGNMMVLKLEPNIRNIKGKELGQAIQNDIVFEGAKPAVRFTGTGVIMPSSNNMLLPFEAVNLKAVDVRVIRIYERNVMQFLQTNEMNGQGELARVGRMVLKKVVPLTNVANYGKWNKYSIDLSDLIKTEPGAIYSVKLSFKMAYSTYPCNGKSSEANEAVLTGISNVQEGDNGEYEYFDFGNENEEYYDEEGNYSYDWSQRENPCNKSYYSGKEVYHNVISSDLGIIAKADCDNRYHAFVSDIVSTQPLPGVEIKFYNYQQLCVGSGRTDNEGTVTVSLTGKPYVLIAKKGDQTGYLKLVEGSSLSLSMFDVGGETVQKGIKGMMYGERGVWRPGDSLYISFILEDKQNTLPEHHPVIFTMFNPSGQQVTNIVKTSSVNGFYNFSTATDRNAPTGNWRAIVKVGGAEFSKNIRIETVKPNRLKINLNFGVDKLVRSKMPKAILTANWLTGATARKLKASVALTLTKSTTSFKNYPQYIFDNQFSGFTTQTFDIFSGKLDETGKAEFSPEINLTTAAPGVLNANFETTVYEEGGDFSIDRFSLPYHPFTSYAGLTVPQNKNNDRMLYTDTRYNIDLINLDPDGKVISPNKLSVQVYKLNWNWWWDNSGERSADFVSTAYNKLTDSLTLTTVNGKASFPFLAKHDDWGRYYVRVTDKRSGHTAGSVIYVDWYGYNRNRGDEKQAATMLTFTADKEKYKTGNRVKLTIPSQAGGRVLITIENGSKVLQSAWVPAKDKTTGYEFDVTPEMAPNCYAYATLVQPHAQVKNDLPIRLYGVIPIFVEDPDTHLKPQIIMKDVLAPEKKASITVKEEHGKPMTYTLAVVDEGLLDLTRFKTPDPWAIFYAREALGVRTWDLFDLVMGAFSGELQRILSVGGDEEGNAKGNLKANRFKPMVKYLGPFELKKGQSKTHTFTMPQYIGSVRVMVVAGDKGAFGSAEKTVAVRTPLMVLGTMPRVVGPGETVKLPVNIFAMEKSVKDVSVEVTTNDLFTLTSGNSRKLSFKNTGDDIVNFDLKVRDAVGVGKIKIIAVSGNEKASYNIEIDVRNPNPRMTKVVEAIVEPGKSWDSPYLSVGMTGTNKGRLEISGTPSMNLEQRLSYLIGYPHGCIEQTTSSVFPQLYLSDLLDLKKNEKDDIEQNIKAGIKRIAGFQTSNGGLSYWPGDQYSDDWGTNYAGNFLLEAEKKGYALPAGFMNKWKNYQKQKAISWNYNATFYNDDLMQAYRLYTLALAKAPEMGAMNKLMEFKNLSNAARWRLAAAYQVSGKPEAAKKLIAFASTDIKPYHELYNTFGSDLRDKAMIVETLCLLDMKAKAAPLVQDIATSLGNSGEWYSTQTTAYALLAVSKFETGKTGRKLDFTYKIDNDQPVKMRYDRPIFSSAINMKNQQSKGSVHLNNSGDNILYARIILSGIPLAGEETKQENNLNMKISYKSMDGKEVNPGKLPQGTNFMVEVSVSNPGVRGEYRQLALTQIFPSGWEIINARMSEEAAAKTKMSDFTYQDVRDDRVSTYFDLAPRQSKIFRIMLSTAYTGRFYQPATYCEAMYDHTINSTIPGHWVEVTTAGK
ncbi:MAG: MG2 domain-containing protein [Bacteroidia bacterium]|nr:MG2 domain-containing protein [Bacteroidia bacterium]